MRPGEMRVRVDGVFFVGRESERGKDHPNEGKREAGAAKGVDAFAAGNCKCDGECRVGRRDWAGDADCAHFEGTIEGEPRNGVDQAGDRGEQPRRPTGSEASREAADQPEKHAEGTKAEELHGDKRAECANAASGKPRGKIRHTPAESCRYSEDDIQEFLSSSGSYRFFGSWRPRTAITFCKSFQTSPFAAGLRSR